MSRKYSIIVVTRNNAEGLRRTLQSVRELVYAEKETIIIDGASTDNTPEVIAEYKDIVTKALSEKDTGIYNAMNKGIALVTGDYVVFMNAGDMFASGRVLSVVNDYDGDIILGSETYGGQVRSVTENMTLYDILSVGVNHQAVYYRREVLQKYGFDESYKLIADFKSVVEPIVRDNASYSCVNEILAVCEGGGVSKQRWRDTIIESRRMISEVLPPLYSADYQKLARINNSMIGDFIVLSQFRKMFPLLRCLAKIARMINEKFKHIPLD